MIGMCFVIVLAVVNSPEVGSAQMRSAMETFTRLAAALPASKPGMTAEEQKAQKAEVEYLLMYLNKTQEVIAIGNWNPAYYQNFLTVMQQLGTMGSQAALLPEEALCWHRAGLNAAAAQIRFIALRVHAGKEPPQNLYQAKANYERSLREYRKALAQLVENAR